MRNYLELLDHLTMDEKKTLYVSLPILNKYMDFFVIRFYNYFLKSEAGSLFKDIDIEKQFRMFHRSLNVLVTHLAEPDKVEVYLDILIRNHKTYGVNQEHVDNFTDSFMKALKEIYTEESDEEIITIWYKVVLELMTYFKNNLELFRFIF